MEIWNKFKGTKWKKSIDVANFIETNYQEYLGDSSFLKPISKKTAKLWKKCDSLIKKENISSVLDIETELIMGVDNYNQGYIDSKEEVIVGLQTDAPLKRGVSLSSGVEDIKKNISRYGFRLNPTIEDKYKEYVKTYQKATNQLYKGSIQKYIDHHLLDGLPTDFDRGRIIGDYRRVALYGVNHLIEQKLNDIAKLSQNINNITVRLIEEMNDQIDILESLKKMAKRYDIDISRPASNAKEAVQWLYMAYLGCIKQNNTFSNGIGRNMAFLDIYITKDLEEGIITETEAQELIDQLVIKLRLVRFLHAQKIEQYNIGLPINIKESIAGMLDENRSFVTKTTYRLLNSLNNLNNYPEPNIVVLWSNKLPKNFKDYVSHMAIKTNVIKFANDDMMRKIFSTDYAISDCASALMLGKQMQLYGSQLNLPKVLLYALNGGRDEITGETVIPDIEQITGEYLDYDIVIKVLEKVLKKVTSTYVDALNIVHEMQDKYHYESLPMSLHNTLISRVMAFGISGLANTVDSLSAIKYGKVRVKRTKEGLTNVFDIDVDYPRYGNSDIRADEIATKLLAKIYQNIKKNKLYRNSEHTLSVISNGLSILYGKHTGSTPDGRKKEEPFSIDANPSKESEGLLSTLSSLAHLPYKVCLDGISNTLFIEPSLLGDDIVNSSNLSHVLDGYFKQGGQYLNLNIIPRQTLIDAYDNPAKYSNLLICISGYIVDYAKLSKEQKDLILKNKFYDKLQ